MFINLEGVIIRKKFIGYAYIVKRDLKWALHIRFMNENADADYLELKYDTKKEAGEALKKLEKMLMED
jgi:hypothetical protein